MGSTALQLTQAALAAPKDLKGVFEIEAFKSNCVANYNKTTGRSDGELVFERERVLFMKAIQENNKLEACSRFSIYSAFVELFVSGLTLNDGLTYIIPYKDTAQFQIGWKGRLEQMSQMPEVNYVPEPQIVLTNELADFEYELGETPRVIKHKPAKDRTVTKENKIEFVYLILDTKFGKRTFLMTRQEVLTIRDTYSIPYKYYMSKGGKWPDGRPMDPPFWITNEAEAFKKTLVKRAYKYLPKTPRMKALDEKIKNYVDHEDGTSETVDVIDYGLVEEGQAQGTQTPAQSENVAQTAQVKAEEAKTKESKTRAPKKEKTISETKSAASENKPAEDDFTSDAKVVVGPGGTKADATTAEVIPDDNPVFGLPDLSAFNS